MQREPPESQLHYKTPRVVWVPPPHQHASSKAVFAAPSAVAHQVKPLDLVTSAFE